MADDDDEEGNFGGMYENGHWAWDDATKAIIFISDLPPAPVEAVHIPAKAPTGAIEFRDDVDLIEQDVKDIALYTAPVNIMSPALINMLHLPTTERFIRALILCCQYYLQISDEMSERMMELETKVRTPDCELLEAQYRDDIADLRVLLAKEYCTMLIGGGDTRKFHHMGPQKKRRSLSDKDARLFETLLRMCVQIVWLALGRKAFNQIELEINRLFKSEIFNAVEHNLHTGYIAKMTKEERAVLLGHCVRSDKKLNTRSPLMNEVFCHRDIDYRMMGIGVIKCPQITSRLQYMMLAMAGSEEVLKDSGIVLGIIGMPRAAFDTMLHPLTAAPEGKSKASMSSQQSSMRGSTKSSISGMKKSTMSTLKLYPNIVLPPKSTMDVYFPPSFPSASEHIRPCSETQRRRWQNRLMRLLHPQQTIRSG